MATANMTTYGSADEARTAAMADQNVITDQGFIVAKTGDAYCFKSVGNPGGAKLEQLGLGSTDSIVERHLWKEGSGWSTVGKIDDTGTGTARELLPETETAGSIPP